MSTEITSASAILSAAVEKKLLRKLTKAGDAEDAEEMLTKAAPGGDYLGLLANLAQRERLGAREVGSEDAIVELVKQVAADLDPAVVQVYLDSIEQSESSWTHVLSGVEGDDLAILARSYQQHANYWDDATISPRLEGALTLVRAQQGCPVDAKLQSRLLDELVEGVLAFADLPENAYALGITPDAWGRRTAPIVLAKKEGMIVTPMTVEALVQAPWKDAKEALARQPFDGPAFVEILCRRDDEPAEVLAFAEEVKPRFEEETDDLAYLLQGLLRRIAPAGLLLPDSWDDWIPMAVVYSPRDRNGLAEAFAGAERTVSAARRHAMILDALASYVDDEAGHYVYPLLRHAWDDALFARALSGLKDKPTLTASVFHNESESLGLVGKPALPILLQELEVARRTPETNVASTLWHSILIAAFATAASEALEEQVLKVLIEPGFNIGTQAQFYCWRYWQKLLQALPPDQRDAILESWTAYDQECWTLCVPGR